MYLESDEKLNFNYKTPSEIYEFNQTIGIPNGSLLSTSPIDGHRLLDVLTLGLSTGRFVGYFRQCVLRPFY